MQFPMALAMLAMACLSLHAAAAEPFTGPAAMSRAGIDVKGWADTRGGSGGRIVRVTNLNASGEGSFAAAVAETGPPIVRPCLTPPVSRTASCSNFMRAPRPCPSRRRAS